jgi:uncharacterized protein (TIGR03437 family)
MKNVRRRTSLLVGVALLVWLGLSFAFDLPAGAMWQKDGAPLPQGAAGGTGRNATVGAGDWVEVTIELEGETAVEAFARAGGATAAKRNAARAIAQSRRESIEQAQEQITRAVTAPAIGAKVLFRLQSVYNGVVVQVASNKLDALRQLPGIKKVHVSEVVYPDANAALSFIGAPVAWATGMGTRGEGMKIGIIDSGIDYIHRNFGGAGAGYESNDRKVIGDAPGFPGAKIAGGHDFVGDDYNAGSTNTAQRMPQPDPDPMDCGGHGSSVASIAAGLGVNADDTTYTGSYDASTPFAALKIGPGVAPAAKLYSLRVFGCTGTTSSAVITQAIEWAVDPNKDGDFSDRLDVINLSLGSAFTSLETPYLAAVNNASLAGVVVAASAGNSGDTYYISGGPALAARAISVAASVDTGINTPALRVNSPANIAGLYEAGTAAFGPALTAAGVMGNLAATAPANACTALTNPQAIAGKIALLDRGGCDFVVKVRNAQAAGAIGVVVINNVAGAAIGMSGTATDIMIPSVMVRMEQGEALRNNLAAPVNVTLSNERFFRLDLADTLTSFTSRGPSTANSALKPDITAPGELTISVASVNSGAGERLFNGTSAAAPFVAGSLALLRQLHPDWTVEELKALAMNTADFDLFRNPNSGLPRYGLARIGAGRVALQHASQAAVVAYNADEGGVVSVSFGAPEVLGTATLKRTVRVVNKGASAVSYELAYTPITDTPGVAYSLPGGTSINVPTGGATTFDIQLTVTAAQMRHTRDASLDAIVNNFPRQFLNEESGYVTLTSATGPRLRVPVYAAPRPVATMSAVGTTLELNATGNAATITLQGEGLQTGGSFPADILSLVSPFELQAISPDEPTSTGLRNRADLKAVGVNSDLAAQGSIGASTIFFGVATHAPWTTPNEVGIEVLIDTNRDNTDDFVLFSGALFNPQNQLGDVFVSLLRRLPETTNRTQLPLNYFPADAYDTAPYNTDVMMLGVRAADLGLSDANPRFNYRVRGRYNGAEIDITPRLTYDAIRPGLNFGTQVIRPSLPGATIDVGVNGANFFNSNSSGVLLLHHHNAIGARAQTLTVPITRATVANSSAASFSAAAVAPESIVAAFGARLATGTANATGASLPTELLGTTVHVRDSRGAEQLAPLFFVSPTQVNYQMPPGVAAGSATVTITTGDGRNISTGTIQIVAAAPGLFSADASGRGLAAAVVLRIKADGTQTFEPVAQFDQMQQRFVAVPIDLGPEGEQVILLLFGTGVRFNSSLAAVTLRLGDTAAPISFAGAQGSFVGLDQINALLPRTLSGRGEVDVALTVDGRAANVVRINIK